jgi:hypothetical protein
MIGAVSSFASRPHARTPRFSTVNHVLLSCMLLAAFKLGAVSSFASSRQQVRPPRFTSVNYLSMSATSIDTSSWSGLQTAASNTKVGAALDIEVESRVRGTGAPFVQNKLRLFGSTDMPHLTLYRDHAGERRQKVCT